MSMAITYNTKALWWTGACAICRNGLFDINETYCEPCQRVRDSYSNPVTRDLILQVFKSHPQKSRYPRPLYATELIDQIEDQFFISETDRIYSDQDLRRMYWLVRQFGTDRQWSGLATLCQDLDLAQPLVDFWTVNETA